MENHVPDTYSIYIRLDEQSVHEYFNHHDPAPLYKRQLGHSFEQYIYNYLITSKRDAIIKYQVVCADYADKRFIAPVTNAIRNHFTLKKNLKTEEFRKFKKRTFRLLTASILIVLTLQGVYPFVSEMMDSRLAGSLHNIIDVFSWVILWKPIDRLIFYWNPFKKEIFLLQRLADAEITVLEKTKVIGKDSKKAS